MKSQGLLFEPIFPSFQSTIFYPPPGTIQADLHWTIQ
jgi:hypothetical protein